MKLRASAEGQKGFTLIEIMIAISVITLLLVGYVGANIVAQRNTEEMNERTVAIQNANQVIERMRNASVEDSFPDNVTDAYPPNSHPTGFTDLNNEVITVSYEDPNANPLVVTVTVAWLSYGGRQHTEAVQTYITQR